MNIHEVDDANNRRLKGIDVRESHPSFLPRLARGPMHEVIAIETAKGVLRPLYENGEMDEGSRVNVNLPHLVVGGVINAIKQNLETVEDSGMQELAAVA